MRLADDASATSLRGAVYRAAVGSRVTIREGRCVDARRARPDGCVTGALVAALALAVTSAGCPSSSAGLVIDVRTDFTPGTDFVAVQTEVSPTRFASSAPEGMVAHREVIGGDYQRGVRVHELPDLAPGSWFVRVTLLSASEERIAQRTVSIRLSGAYAITVVLARSCVGVVCPPAAGPSRTECNGGLCVDPECSPANPSACPPPACTVDADCAALGPCARSSCASGACLFGPSDALCAESEACGPDFRCSPRSDAGASDAGQPDAGPAISPLTAWFLPRGSGAWTMPLLAGDVPTDPIEAAFAELGTDEMMVLTHTELFVLRISTRSFVARRSRDAVFPEVAGQTLQGATIVGVDLYLLTRDVWMYGWSNTARAATFVRSIPHGDLGPDWSGPLTPPWWQLYATFYVPDNTDGWATADPVAMVCGASTVNNYAAYLSTDGFGPRHMVVTVYDATCSQFVDQSGYGDGGFTAFSLPGAPANPWEIDEAEWYDGLWVFTSPE